MLKKRCVVVICDSLRNDLVGATTPCLDWLQSQGTRFMQAQAVFPSTTRVSSASIATGCYPARHGLLGNTMILRQQGALVTHSVGPPEFRQALYEATGEYLRVPTLAQRLQPHCTTAIYSNVSPGAAYFFDPECYGYVYHPAGSYGPGGVAIPPEQGLPIKSGAAGDQFMTERFCERLLTDNTLGLAVLWLSEPDASGHAQVLGSTAHRDAIDQAEQRVAQVYACVEQLRQRGEDILLIVGSDHGMETISQQVNIAQALVNAGFKQSIDSHEIVVAPNGTAAILGFGADYPLQSALLAWLKDQPWLDEFVAGADLARWGLPNEDACRIAISLKGNSSQVNAAGIPGTSWYAFDPDSAKNYLGMGQHGGRHCHEYHPFLIIQGSTFPPAAQIATPVSLVDYAPTILQHLGIAAQDMDGQALQPLCTTTAANTP